MRIIEDENLLDNVTKMGEYTLDQLYELQQKHPIIGDVRDIVSRWQDYADEVSVSAEHRDKIQNALRVDEFRAL